MKKHIVRAPATDRYQFTVPDSAADLQNLLGGPLPANPFESIPNTNTLTPIPWTPTPTFPAGASSSIATVLRAATYMVTVTSAYGGFSSTPIHVPRAIIVRKYLADGTPSTQFGLGRSDSIANSHGEQFITFIKLAAGDGLQLQLRQSSASAFILVTAGLSILEVAP